MTPLQISFQGMRSSPSIEEDVRERLEWLGTYGGPILGCHVAVQVPHRHRTNGRTCRVAVRLAVPGDDIVVNHDAALVAPSSTGSAAIPTAPGGHEGIRMVIHAAFDIARRRLEDVARRERAASRSRAD